MKRKLDIELSCSIVKCCNLQRNYCMKERSYATFFKRSSWSQRQHRSNQALCFTGYHFDSVVK